MAHHVAGGRFERDPSTGAVKKYYRFGGRLVAEREVPAGGGAGTLHYLHQDHLGSTSLQTSAAGTYEGHQFRGPFGQPWQAGGSLATDLQYTAQRSLEGAWGRPSTTGRGSTPRFWDASWCRTASCPIRPTRRISTATRMYATPPLRYADPTGHTVENRRMGETWEGIKQEDDGSIWRGWYRQEPWGPPFVRLVKLSDPRDGGPPCWELLGQTLYFGWQPVPSEPMLQLQPEIIEEHDTPGADDAATGARQQRQVVVDTNTVYQWRQGGKQLLREGEVPVITRTTLAELQNNAARRRLGTTTLDRARPGRRGHAPGRASRSARLSVAVPKVEGAWLYRRVRSHRRCARRRSACLNPGADRA